MHRIPNFARALVASALLLGPGIATAQTVDRNDNRVGMDDRRGFDIGWLGLLGLAGLVGLKGRDKATTGYKASNQTAAAGRL